MANELNLYTVTIVPMLRALENLSGILDKAAAHADARKLDWMNFEEALLGARLVFNQFPFIRQVQVACDNAKGAAARMSGVEAPKMEDTEKTIAELKARVDKTLEYVKSVKPEAIIGRENEMIEMPVYFNGKKMVGYDYSVYYAMPNFYFHMATAYSILRANGVELGKSDFLGDVPMK